MTKAGEKFQRFFQKTIDGFDELMRQIESEHISTNENLRIGIFEGCDFSIFLESLLFDFQIRYKNIHVSFASGSAMQLIEGMNSRQYDAILLFRTTIDGFRHIGVLPDVQVEELFTVEKCVVYSDKNDVCTQGKVTLDSFREQTLLVLKNDQLPASIVTNEELFQHVGWRPKI